MQIIHERHITVKRSHYSDGEQWKATLHDGSHSKGYYASTPDAALDRLKANHDTTGIDIEVKDDPLYKLTVTKTPAGNDRWGTEQTTFDVPLMSPNGELYCASCRWIGFNEELINVGDPEDPDSECPKCESADIRECRELISICCLAVQDHGNCSDCGKPSEFIEGPDLTTSIHDESPDGPYAQPSKPTINDALVGAGILVIWAVLLGVTR